MGCQKLNTDFFNFLEVIHPKKRVPDKKKRISASQYVYQYKDHLGNIRLSYTDVNQNNSSAVSLIIKEENNYYPFGLKQKGYNANINDVEHKYKYNNKELQQELGLNMYDYGARNYDPALGRWFVIDAFAEKAPSITPYRYAFNNPISIIDPDGNQENEPCDMGGNCSSVTIYGMKGGGSFTFGSSSGVVYTKHNPDGTTSTITEEEYNQINRDRQENDVRPFEDADVNLPEVEVIYKNSDSYRNAARNIMMNVYNNQDYYQNGGGIVSFNRYNISSKELKNNLYKLSEYMAIQQLIYPPTINVTSGDRSKSRNDAVKGASKSRHLVGDAADFYVVGISDRRLSIYAYEAKLFNMVIYYPNINAKGVLRPHVHVDLRQGTHSILIYKPIINKGINVQNKYVPFKY